MTLPSPFAIEPRHLREFYAFISAARRWSHLDPALAADADLRALLEAHPTDGAEHQRIEDARREIADKYERQSRVFDATLSAITDFVYIFDREGRFLYANKALLDLWGLKLEAAVGKNFYDLQYPDELAAKLQRQIQQVIETRGRVSDETSYTSPTGEAGYYEYIFSPVFAADGSVEAVAGSTRDITERRRIEAALQAAAEAAEAANSSKDRFLAVLSHELRTPLTPVLMTAAALRADENLSPEFREQLGMIERNVTLEARLIDDLLDLTRIAHGKLVLRAEPCDAHSLLGLVVEMVRSDALEKRIAIRFELSALRSHLTGDPARLQQVFWNLLRNAVKFTPAGGHILVRSCDGAGAPGEPAGTRVCIEVSDDGIGFEPEAAARIFQPFEQSTSGHHFGGLGLGLAIARAVVDMHGGAIRAASAGPGQGATFTVELPATISPQAEAGAAFNPEHPGPGDLRENDTPWRLLLVEDHDPTLQVLARLLVRAGHRITTARSLAEARAAAAGEKFDLVISDLGLPDGTGLELMNDLRAAHGLRGIALSGYGTDADLRRSQDAGFVAHLVKPVDINELRRVLRRIPVPKPGGLPGI